MVIAASEAEEETPTMAMGEERSTRSSSLLLHNFTAHPCFNIKWGSTRHLRCVKDAATVAADDDDQDHHHHRRWSPDRKRRSVAALEDDGGIEAMREKLMLDLRTEVHQMKAAILSGGGGGEGSNHRRMNGEVDSTATAAAEARPWNLRTRRAVCKEPNNNNNAGAGGGCGDRKSSLSPARHFDGDGREKGGGRRAEFSGTLSKQEIEQDFLKILGTRPARRPKKRPKFVQKSIDGIFPGFWLSEITADMYKVNENPDSTGKR